MLLLGPLTDTQRAAINVFFFVISVNYNLFEKLTDSPIFVATLRPVWGGGLSTRGYHYDGKLTADPNDVRSIHTTARRTLHFVSQVNEMQAPQETPPMGVNVSNAYARNGSEVSRITQDTMHAAPGIPDDCITALFDQPNADIDALLKQWSMHAAFVIDLSNGVEVDAAMITAAGIKFDGGVPTVEYPTGSGQWWSLLQGDTRSRA